MPEVTARLDRKTKARLEKLAAETRRSESRLVAEAIRSYVEVSESEVDIIRKRIKEADAGNFATDREVQAFLRKWKRRAG